LEPARAIASGGDSIAQANLDILDATLRKMVRRHKPGTIEYQLARQNLEALRDSKLVLIFDNNFDGSAFADFLHARDRFALTFNLWNIKLNSHYRGVRFSFGSFFAHESGHYLQWLHESFDKVVIGRALKEYDAMLRMSVFQNMFDDASGAARQMSTRKAIDISIDYALEEQWRLFDLSSPGAPSFREPNKYFDGLFQLTHKEAVARGKVFFPDASERDIIESYIDLALSKYKKWRTTAFSNPWSRQANLDLRHAKMLQDARDRLAMLPPNHPPTFVPVLANH
jgi:hypothetical protein